jgi:hypothetical protein
MDKVMRYPIDDKIIKSTKCDHDYECLYGVSTNCKCSIDHRIYGEHVFLVPDDKINKNCSYIVDPAGLYACTCPVKIEICRKYK